ncbi:MAG TPA: DUF4197 domain-containing protein [Nitrospirota bacterium]|nr:DUF4197 domain-containing protein [Nitrospirota bacterium]
MRFIVLFILSALLLVPSIASSKNIFDELNDLKHEYIDEGKSSSPLDSKKVASGLKEALSVGSRNSVALVSKIDGYFKNPAITIPLPENVRKIEHTLRSAGLGREVDEFLLSMNRAAEKAAPQALDLFLGAIKEMTIPDAISILRGHETAATDYLKGKTSEKLYQAFHPQVSAAMNSVGVTRSFKRLMDEAKRIPFLKHETVDLDHYVTSRALDGLFLMVGKEEAKIRKDPAARVTELLREVFR